MTRDKSIATIGKQEPERKLWEKLLPLERDGKKLTINRKKMTILVALGVGIFSVVQILTIPTDERLETAEVKTSSKVATTSDSHIAPQTLERVTNEAKEPKSKSKKGRYVGATVIARPVDLSKIPPGSLIEGKLITGASNGLVRAEATSSLSSAGEILIPEGSILVGSGNSSEERLFVNFKQIVLKDGSVSSINAQACDKSDRIVGLKGSKLGNRALNIAGAVGLGFVGGFSQGLQNTQGQMGAVIAEPTMKNALLNGISAAALEQSQNLMSELKNRTPIIEVPAGTEICIIASGSPQ